MTDHQQAVRRFLAEAALQAADIDRFLDPDQPNWARFDTDLGYVPNDSNVFDGHNAATSTYRYGPLGERFMINYRDVPCRINTFGDSFTQCHQVSDGETWQEYLAANIGEPIRNFGVGGYGVYQADLRLRRIQESTAGTENVILNIFLDDHYRNLDAYRQLRVGADWWQRQRNNPVGMFHANPWRHVRFDPSGQLTEQPNPCPTPESLYQLCDTEFLMQTFGDDLIVDLLVGEQTRDFSFIKKYRDLAMALGVVLDMSSPSALASSAHQLYTACAFRSSIEIIKRTQKWLASRASRLLVLLSYPGDEVARVCGGEERTDDAFVRELDELGIDYLDGLQAHCTDYEDFALLPVHYADRYYYGHYTPSGNHFFAMSVARPALIDWLNPPPPAYRGSEAAVDVGRLAPGQPT